MGTATRAVPSRLGSWWEGPDACVRVWAPEHRALELVVFHSDGESVLQALPMVKDSSGFFSARIQGAVKPFLYKVKVDGEGPFPDPWCRHLPFGVHGPSEAIESNFTWTDGGWRGVPLESLILYEVHVGTATPEGTFEALIPKLKHLCNLGVTALELLPVASFPGNRNWGYDGVALFAPAAVYGGPEGLKRLIDAAHAHDLAVIMDVVYNHFGPEGNYLSAFSKGYFNSEKQTPWGDAINYGGDPSGVVRELAASNAEMWISEYHADGLRLDATHAIVDATEPHLVQWVASRARAAAPHRRVVVIAEDDRNDTRLLLPPEVGGYGLDALWADDFHHQLRRAFAGDCEGYFQDYSGSVKDIVTTLQEGWFYRGQHSRNFGGPRGTQPTPLSPIHFVHCIQNHDQIGNRPLGNRLGEDVSPAAFRAMSAVLLLSPYTPLLFAGQEWNTRAPFLYFTNHSPELGKRVTEGRRREFAGFSQFKGEAIPDPQARETFSKSILDWSELEQAEHSSVLALYRELLALRRSHPALKNPSRDLFAATALGDSSFALERRADATDRLLLVVNIRGKLEHAFLEGNWAIALHTEEARFGGSGNIEWDGRTLRVEGPCAVLLKSQPYTGGHLN